MQVDHTKYEDSFLTEISDDDVMEIFALGTYRKNESQFSFKIGKLLALF